MNSSPSRPTPLHEHVFSSSATVFTLEDKNWTERGCGLVKFIFDLSSYQLRLVIRPGTVQEFECRLRPRIRSKGPRAYVVRANSIVTQDEDGEELILAIRFDREIDSRAFRRFVEERDQPSMSNFDSQGNRPGPSMSQMPQAFANGHGHSPGHGEYISGGGERVGYHSTSYQEEQTADGFFWSCSRCTMMNDAQAPACYVCGTQRDVVSRSGGGGVGGGGGGAGGGGAQGDVPMPHYGSGYGSAAHGGAVYHHSQHSSSTPTPASPQPERMQVQLTQQNLERLNLLYPPKKRSVLEIILEQLRIQERLAMAEHR